MKYLELAGVQQAVSNVVVGMMRINDKSDAEIRAIYDAARENGINMIDHANIYGGNHLCERRFAEAVPLSASERADVVIQTKAGIVPSPEGTHFEFSYDELVTQAEESLRSLNTDYIDVFLLHRPDSLVEPEEVARAFDHLHESGKVRAFGVSNQTPRQMELLRKHVNQPLVANQLQLSITHCPIIAEGISTNMQHAEQSVVVDGGGILDYCRLTDTTIQAWSPFQKGFFDGVFLGDPDFPELNAAIDRIAAKYGVTPTAIAVAWITRHPANMQVVLGTTNPQRVADAAAGSEIPLTHAEWYELFRTAGHIVP
ncbi:Predicted oxidoreductase [Ruaniaceae bacterium KH17]|nr:Predicted oxidoreductase [Ruaniaceae bacterium KH17]